MARRSQRLSSTSAGAVAKTHKRSASHTTASTVESKRSKTKATPTKSQYFSNSKTLETSADDDNDEMDASSALSDESEASEFGEESQATQSSEENDDDEYDSDVNDTPKQRKKVTPNKGTATSGVTSSANSGGTWKAGVKAGLGPGTQLVIKRPQARPAGKNPYRDDTIHPNTLLFLKELKANNERQWLKSKSSSKSLSDYIPASRACFYSFILATAQAVQ